MLYIMMIIIFMMMMLLVVNLFLYLMISGRGVAATHSQTQIYREVALKKYFEVKVFHFYVINRWMTDDRPTQHTEQQIFDVWT